jgi:G3E family GTPase
MERNAAPDHRTPVSLLTGFLGSGKTTLLNAWLRDPAMADAAVIVNEFGEIGIDHSLIASSNDNTIELSTGCLCCTVRGDLVETLRSLREKRIAGEVPNFSRVLIETTGLADPVPVIQALITFPVARAFRLGRVITAIDAVNGLATLDAHPEAVRQAVVADELVVTKTDLPDAQAGVLAERLRRLNPGAGLTWSTDRSPPAASLLEGIDIYSRFAGPEAVRDWISADRYQVGEAEEAPGSEHHHHHHHHDVNRHSADIGSFCLTFDEPLYWEHVSAWLDALVMAHADQLLRVKGIVDIAGRPRPIVLQAVQRLFHPPAELAAWPPGDRRSRMVFITRGLSRAFVLEVLETLRSRIPVDEAGVL